MSSRIRISPILALAAVLTPIHGAADALTVQILQTADFGTRLSLCVGLGKRADPTVGDVIAFLCTAHSTRSIAESENLLSALLGGLLDPAWGRDGVTGRYEANRPELEGILGKLHEIGDPLLAALLIRTLRIIGDTAHEGALLRLAGAYGERFRRSAGRLDPGGTQCVLALLSYAAELGSWDFLDPCLSLVGSSRDQGVIRAARSAASRIAARTSSPNPGGSSRDPN